MLSVNELSKTYQSGFFSKSSLRAVDGVSFQIEKGECFGIIGESGSGKTTIGKMVIGLLPLTSGEIQIGGQEAFRRRVQMIFQEPDGVFDPNWRIGQSMLEPYHIHTNLSTKEKQREVLRWLDVVGLGEEHLDRYPFELSGGQLQRLAFARAMSLEPDLIVADEPTSSLDVSVQAQILTLMREIQQKYQQTILYITHDLYVARQMCDHLAVMEKGRFVEMGSAESVYSAPQSEYTKKLLSSQLPPDMSSRDRIP